MRRIVTVSDPAAAPALGLLWVLAAAAAAACAVPSPRAQLAAASTGAAEVVLDARPEPTPGTVRVALFNVRELSMEKLADVDAAGAGRDPQLRAAAEIVKRVRPDVLLVQEIDYPGDGDPAAAVRAFAGAYLATGGAPIEYPHAFAAPVNTGVLSGFDLNDDGVVATAADRGTRRHGDDSLGWGTYPGQYGMAVLSRLPLDAAAARTFRTFRWRDLPGHHVPPGFYSEEELAVLPLSSKSHWDLPVALPEAMGGGRLHLWISHPTPPVFDGPEDRNGRRNFDENRFWVLYLEGADALVDDAGRRGGYAAGEPFVVAGDLNADPRDREGAVYDGVQSAEQLLAHPRLTDAGALLTSPGAARHERVGGAHPERSTVVFDQGMRIDHLIPGGGAVPVAGGVWWPAAEDDPAGAALAEAASDHHLVWLDLRVR
jgi:endonuclease/exonuclease/phosphatase family metal-dependent hydrolase